MFLVKFLQEELLFFKILTEDFYLLKPLKNI